MKYIQSDAHRFAPRGRHTGGKHVLVNDTTGGCMARSCYRRKRHLPGFPAERMCVDTSRHPKGNKVSGNVVRLDNIMYVVVINVSPTTKLKVQLAPVALCTNAVPGD